MNAPAVYTVEGFELPWQQGSGSYSDACRVESTVVRVHPQSQKIGLGRDLTTRSRIAHVVETTAGQGARTAAFIVRACNSHADLVRELEGLLEWVENNVAYGCPGPRMARIGEALQRAKGTT